MKLIYKQQYSCIIIVILTAVIIAFALNACDTPDYQNYAQLTALGTDTITWQVGNDKHQQVITDWWTATVAVYPGDTVRLTGKCQIYLTILEDDCVHWIQQCENCTLEYINN